MGGIVIRIGSSLAALGVMLSITSKSTHAQPAAVQAQSLFEEGRKLLLSGEIAKACTAFEASQKLDPVVTTLLNLASCHEKDEKLATAWGEFLEANRMAKAASNSKLAVVASGHADRLKPLLSRLTIQVAADRRPAGLEITRDGDPVAPTTWNYALPIDGGTYTFVAGAPGYKAWSATIMIDIASDTKTIEIPNLVENDDPTDLPRREGSGADSSMPESPDEQLSASAVGASPTLSTAGASSSTATVTIEQLRRSHAIPIALGASALALGGAALAAYFSANERYDDAKLARDQGQPFDEPYDSANTRYHIAQGLGIAAVGCASVAIYFFLRGRSGDQGDNRRTDGTSAIRLAPVASHQVTGLAIFGGW